MSELQNGEEGRRQAYLAALGIPLWSSRQDLPGALPGDGLVFSAFVDVGAATELAEAAPEAAAYLDAPAAMPRQEVREPAPVSSSLPATARTAPASTAPVTASATAAAASTANPAFPRFTCRVELLAPGWLGVISLDDVPDLSAQEYRLLGNLVQALGGDGATAGAREHFRWPLSPNPAIPRDAGAAREALAAFLGRRREATRWLVLGETLSVYVRAALPQHTVIAAPMLRELLENPSAKRHLWQALHG